MCHLPSHSSPLRCYAVYAVHYTSVHTCHTPPGRAPLVTKTRGVAYPASVYLWPRSWGHLHELAPLASKERYRLVSQRTVPQLPSSYKTFKSNYFACVCDLFFFRHYILHCFSFSLVVGCNPVSFREVIKSVINRIIHTYTLSPLPLPSTDCTQDHTGKGDRVHTVNDH